jgi:starch synthase
MRNRVQIYFLDNEEYFGNRKSLYIDPLSGENYADNDERFVLFSRSIFELTKKLGWAPDIIHAHDWQTALVPAFLKTTYQNDEFFKKVRTVLTIHNFEYGGEFPLESFEKTGLSYEFNNEDYLVHNGKLNFLKAGIIFSDIITTVSPGYRNEVIVQPELSRGLDSFLNKRKDSFFGVINGIDKKLWNPATDKFIVKNFELKNIENKYLNKKNLVERFGLSFESNVPVFSIIARLYDYKGIDLLAESLPEIMKLNIQVLLLGTGEMRYMKIFDQFAKKYPSKFACYLGFNDELAHLIEAGSDFYLMPSKTEPCGLNQMYSLLYGTIPIVRKTGGLSDTVIDYSAENTNPTGLVFEEYSASALIKQIHRAIDLYGDKEELTNLMKNGMRSDFSWQLSAKKYVELYKNVSAS